MNALELHQAISQLPLTAYVPTDRAKARDNAEQMLSALYAICNVYYNDKIGNRAKRAEVMRELAAIAIAKAEGR